MPVVAAASQIAVELKELEFPALFSATVEAVRFAVSVVPVEGAGTAAGPSGLSGEDRPVDRPFPAPLPPWAASPPPGPNWACAD